MYWSREEAFKKFPPNLTNEQMCDIIYIGEYILDTFTYKITSHFRYFRNLLILDKKINKGECLEWTLNFSGGQHQILIAKMLYYSIMIVEIY